MANLKYIGKNILNHTLEIKKGDVSGSSSSTGSFGRIEGTTLEASSFGSSTGTLISGSFTSTSSSLASRITTAESELGNTLISSSAQIASDISGSFTSTSSSLASRITTAESELGNTLISSSVQIASDISGSWRGALSGSLNIISGSSTSTGSFGKLVGDGFSVTNIQNSVNSQNIYVDHGDTSLVTRLVNITSISDGNTGLKVPSNPLYYYNRHTNPITGQSQGSDYLYIGGGSNTAGGLYLNSTVTVSPFVYSNYGTLHIRAAGTTGLLELSSSLDVRLGNNTQLTGSLEFTGNITGSSTSTGSFGKVTISELSNSDLKSVSSSISSRLTTAETELGNTLISSSAQIADDISGSFTSTSSSLASRITTEEGNVDTLQARNLIAGDGLTGGGTLAADRTFNIGAGTGIDVTADAISVDVSDFMTNGSNNRIVTSVNADSFNAEENFTFDGSELVLTGNATITGNLDVQGTQTSIDSATLNIGDKNITIGSGSTTSAQLDAGGIDFGLGGTIANLRYKHSNTSITSSVDFRAPTFYGVFNGALSSSAQIASNISGSLGSNATLIRSLTATGISGSVNSLSSSLSTRLTTDETNITNLQTDSGSFSSRLTTAETELGNTLISSSAQIADDISGSFTAGTGLDLSSGQFSVDVSDFMSNGVNNRVLTATGTDAINAEANLTFDGSTLNVVGDVSSSSTSTGSFGNLRIAGNSAFGDLRFDTFPYNSNSNSGQFLTLKAQDTSDKAILELASANVSSGNVVGEIHFINRSGGAGFNPIANITSHFSQGLLFKTQYGNNGEKVGIRITEENNAPPEVIIPSGSLEVKGNVSGSSTSTGSFGRIFSADSANIAGLEYPTADDDDGSVFMTNGSGVITLESNVKYVNVKNVETHTLSKGTPVHATGTTGNTPEVVAASASISTKMPATFVLAEQLTAGSEGRAVLSGFLNGIDTSGFTEGNNVYVGADGGYTESKPTGTNLIQNIAIVGKVDGSNGSIFVYGSGRSNDVPNLLNDHIFFGSGSDQMQQLHVSGAIDHATLNDITFVGDISGSSTSTGSFGTIQIDDNTNLNADLLDGQHGSYYLDFGNFVIDDDEIPIAKLASDSVSYGGVSVTLGSSDATPAFNLSDATSLPIVAGTTGTLSVARGGTGATSLNNLITLGTHTTGNYVASLVAGTGIDLANNSGETATPTVSVDVSDFMSNGSNNRVLTATGADAMNAEANLTFDGSTLDVVGDITLTKNDGTIHIKSTDVNNSTFIRMAEDGFQGGFIKYDGSGNKFIIGTHNAADSNASNDIEALTISRDGTKISGSSTSTGSFGSVHVPDKIGIGTTAPNSMLHVDGGDIRLSTNKKIYFHDTNDYNYLHFNAGRLTLGYTADAIQIDMNGSSVKTIEMQANSDFRLLGKSNKDIILEPQGTGIVHVKGAISGSSLDVTGNIRAVGDVIAQRYIVSSSVTHLTQSFSSGSTIFGDSADDTHLFVGSKISGSSNLTGSFGKLDFRGTGEKVFLKYNHGSNANLNVGLKHFDNGSGGQFAIVGGSTLQNRVATFQYSGGAPRLGIGVTNPTNSSLAISAPADNDIQLDVSTGGNGYYGLGMANSGQHRYLLGNTYSTTTTRFSITAGGLTTAHDRITIYNALGNGREHYVGINKGATNPAHSLDVSGSIVFANGTQAVQISGSSTSTGSFGSVETKRMVMSSTAEPRITFNRVGEGSADIYYYTNGTGLIVDSDAPIQLDYTTSLRILKAGSETARFTANGGLAFGDSSSTTSVLTIKSDSNSPISFEKSSNRQNYLEFKKTSGNLTQPWLIGVGTDTTGTEFRVKNGSATPLTIASGSGNTVLSGSLSVAATETKFQSDTANQYTRVRIDSGTSQYQAKLHLGGRLGANADYLIGEVAGIWDVDQSANPVAAMRFESGNDHVNKDDGRITFWTSEASRTLTERMRIDYNGKIGIGETSPLEQLSMEGNIFLTDTSPAIYFKDRGVGDSFEIKRDGHTAKLTEYSSGVKSSEIHLQGRAAGDGASRGGILFRTATHQHSVNGPQDAVYINLSGSVELMRDGGNLSGSATSTASFGAGYIDNKLGIGTTSPADSIDIQQTDSVIRFKNTGASNFEGIELYNPSTGNFVAGYGSYGNTTNGYIRDAGGTPVIFNSSGWGFYGRNIKIQNTGASDVGFFYAPNTKKLGLGGEHAPAHTLHISGSGNTDIFVEGNVSGSSTSTGSFGRVEATSISASLYQGQIGSRYVHSQTSDSATWVINHNIGHKYPVVTVYDTNDQMILPSTGTATDSDTFTLTFTEAIQGKAVVSVGGIGENAGANYIHTQGASSTNWRVTHSLSQQYPNVTVYDDTNQVIIPESITAASSNEMDITFSSGKTGYANFSIGSGIPNISAQNAGKVLKVRSGGQGVEWSPTSNDVSGSMSVSGSITPTIDNFHNLGSATHRWANLHTGDIQLSNEGTEGNEVDGTTGSWTIQEGEDDLYLLNRKNGKKYKFKLEEIT